MQVAARAHAVKAASGAPPTGRREAHFAARPPALRLAQRGPAPRLPLGGATASRVVGRGRARGWGRRRRGPAMAHLETQYQRLESSSTESPPGGGDLLVHVPEGAKCEPGAWAAAGREGAAGRGAARRKRRSGLRAAGCGLRAVWSREGPVLGLSLVLTLPLLPAAPWHHIENLDLFFSRISFRNLWGGGVRGEPCRW